jgi:hypothetical protein
VPNCHTELQTYFWGSKRAPSRLFSLLALRLKAASSREIAHMQAGQCGNQMGAKFWGGSVRRAQHRRRRRVLRRQRRAARPHHRVLPLGLGRQVFARAVPFGLCYARVVARQALPPGLPREQLSQGNYKRAGHELC